MSALRGVGLGWSSVRGLERSRLGERICAGNAQVWISHVAGELGQVERQRRQQSYILGVLCAHTHTPCDAKERQCMFHFFTFLSFISWSDSELESADVWCVMHLVLSVGCKAKEGLTVDLTVLWWSCNYTLAVDYTKMNKSGCHFEEQPM